MSDREKSIGDLAMEALTRGAAEKLVAELLATMTPEEKARVRDSLIERVIEIAKKSSSFEMERIVMAPVYKVATEEAEKRIPALRAGIVAAVERHLDPALLVERVTAMAAAVAAKIAREASDKLRGML